MKRRALFLLMPAILAFAPGAHAQSPNTFPTPPPLPRTAAVPSPAQAPITPVSTSQNKQPAAPGTVHSGATPVPSVPLSSITIWPGNSSLILKPVHPLSPDKMRLHLIDAQRQLKTRLRPTALTPSLFFVTVAALDTADSKIHLLTLPKDTFLTKGVSVTLVSSLGTPLRLQIVRPNYVNTAVTVSDLTGRQLLPLMVEYPIEHGGVFHEMAYYTSAHPALLSPELVKTGKTYVRTMIDAAAKRLKDQGVTITPQVLNTAEHLCVVEHVDHDRFRRENRIALYEEIYSLYALNELDTYRYSVSFAGAGGMVQMIPSTYQMLRRLHPAVGLNPDFVAGMRNHGNALEAMLLYMQDTWNDLLLQPDINSALAAKIATPAELLAAGYNSNPAHLALYLRRGGIDWRMLIPRETQTYLQIYDSLDALVPMKPHE